MTTRFVDAPSEVRVGAEEPLVYRLELATGAEPVRVRVRVRENAAFGTEHGRPEGLPTAIVGFLAVEGDGVEESRGAETGQVACAASGGALHGLEPRGAWVELWIPARGVATVVGRFAVAPTPSWPGTDYRPTFAISGYRGGAATVSRPNGAPVAARSILPPPLRAVGARGVRIVLETDVPTAPYARQPAPPFPAGTPLRVIGTTDPPLRGGTITLRHRSPQTGDSLADVAAVALDERGSFSYGGWRPGGTGFNELWAFVAPATATGLTPDHFCPRGFVVEGWEPAVAPGFELRAVSARAVRTRRSRFIDVVAACSGPVGGRCGGRLALRTGRARGSAPLSLASGATATVRIRLPRRGTLPGRIAVAVEGGSVSVTRASLLLRGPRRAGR